jgi:hypothetical protein
VSLDDQKNLISSHTTTYYYLFPLSDASTDSNYSCLRLVTTESLLRFSRMADRVEIKRNSRRKSGYEVEKRDDGYFYGE